MGQIRRAVRPRLLAALASLAFVFVLSTCENEAAGPARRRAALAIQAELPPAADLAGFGLTIDNLRLIVVRLPSDTAFDSTFAFGASLDSLRLTADVPLEQSPETFQVTIQMLSGSTLLFSGKQSVDLSAGQSNPPAQIPVSYAGPGRNVATLTIDPPDSVLSFGGSMTFRPTALDSQGIAVPSFYVSWTTSDTAAAKIDATGHLVAPNLRSTLNVLAHTPNSVTASTPITFIPVPNRIVAVSGCGQSASPGAQLPLPVVVQVLAADGLGVRGVLVHFTPPAGGSAVPAQDTTDAGGLVQTAMTLPTGAGIATFQVSAGGLTMPCDQNGVASATQIVFSSEPPATVVAGTQLPPIVVTARDALGNTATTFTGNVTLALGTHPTGAVLSGTVTVAAVAGVASFTNLAALTMAGGYTLVASVSGLQSVASASFTVTPAAAAALAFTTQPSSVVNGAIMTPAVQVAVQDAFGNTVTSATNQVTLSLTVANGATLGGTLARLAASGVATFTGLTVDKAGTYSLTAAATSLTGATSTPFTVSAGAVTQLAVSLSAGSVTAGTAASATVTAQDGSGNTVTGYTGTIKFTSSDLLAVLPANYTFVAGDNGTHVFSGGVTLKQAGSQTVTATDVATATITGTTSAIVSPAAAAKLAFSTQPGGATPGVAISAVVVAVRDAFDNLVTTANNQVTMALGPGSPGGATLSGTKVVGAVNGLAQFADLTIDIAGTGFTLSASAAGLTGAVSTPFNVAALSAGVAWNNPAGGNWGTAANWTPARVPGKSDSVFINLPGTYTVTLDVNDTVAFLTVGGSSGAQLLSLVTSRTLTVDSAAAIGPAGAMTLSADSLGGGGTLVNQGVLTLTSSGLAPALANVGTVHVRGSSRLAGTLSNSANGRLVIEGSASGTGQLTVANGFVNLGTVQLTNADPSFARDAILTVSNGTFVNQDTLAILPGTNGGNRFLQVELDNRGPMLVGQTVSLSRTGAAHANSGSIELAGGNVVVSQSGVSPTFSTSGTIQIAAGDTFTVNGGAFAYAAGTIAGSGSIDLTNGAVTLTPDLTNDVLGVVLVNETVGGTGHLVNAAGATLTLTSTTVNAPFDNHGTVHLLGSNTVNGVLSTFGGSTLGVEGSSVGTGQLAVTTGLANAGDIVLSNVDATFARDAILTVTGGALTNAPAGTIVSAAGTHGGNRFLRASLTNQGAVTVDQTLTMDQASAVHANTGSISLTTGDLALNQSGTTPSFTTSGTGSLVIPAGDTVAVFGGTFTYAGGSIGGRGALTFSSVTVALTPDLTNDTLALSLTNTTVSGPGKLVNAAGASLVLTAVTVNAPLDNHGTLHAQSSNTVNGAFTTFGGSTARVEGSGFGTGQLTVTAGLVNLGAIELSDTDPTFPRDAILTVTGGALSNEVSGTITSLVGTHGGQRFLRGSLANQGTVTVVQGLAMDQASAVHLNPGTIALAGGNLTVSQSGTTPSFATSGTLTIAVGDTLVVNGGAFSYGGGALGGLGLVQLSNGTLNLTPSLVNDTLAFALTNETVNGPGTFTNAAPRNLLFASVTMNAPLVNNGVLHVRSSNSITGGLTTGVGSTLQVEGSSLGTGVLTVPGGFTNNGAVQLSDSDPTFARDAILSIPSGPFTNAVGRTVVIAPGTNGGNRFLRAVAFSNLGQVTLLHPLTMDQASAVVTNGGAITLSGGDLTVSQSGTTPRFTNSASGTITMPAGRTFSVNGGTFAFTAGVLGGTGTVQLSNGTANLASPITNDTLAFVLTNETVNGPGSVTNQVGRTMTFQSVTMNAPLINAGTLIALGNNAVTGGLTTAAGSILRIAGSSLGTGQVAMPTGFTNVGGVELTNVDPTFARDALLTLTTGTLTNGASGSINSLPGTNGGNRFLRGSFTNQGQVAVTQTLTLDQAGAVYSNTSTGSIALTTGDLSLTQSGASPSFTTNGLITIASGRTLTTNGGAFNYGGPFNGLGGLGTALFLNTTVALTPDLTNDTLTVVFANSTVNGPGKLINLRTRTLTLQTVTVNAPLDNHGLLRATGITNVNGALTTDTSSTISVEGTSAAGTGQLKVAGSFANGGVINLTNSDPTFARDAILAMPDTASLGNGSGAVIASLPGTKGGNRSLNVNLSNAGTLSVAQALTMNEVNTAESNSGLIQLAGGDLTVTLSGTLPGFDNLGTIDVGTNKLTLNGTGTFTNRTFVGLNFIFVGTLLGSGTIDVSAPGISFSNGGRTLAGDFSAAGILKWVGPYTPGTSASAFLVDLGGNPANPGVDFDQFQGSDNVTLSGGLTATVLGAQPAGTYVIISLPAGKTFTGDFQSKTLPADPLKGPCTTAISSGGNQYQIICP
jgi:hypothetical protein